MNGLARLIYMSRAVAAGPAELDAILQSASRNNARDGLTGVLLLHRGRFIQALEGPAAAVSDCLHRIDADPRHADLVLMRFGPIRARALPRRTLQHVPTTPANEAQIDALLRALSEDQPGGDAALRALLALAG